MAEDTGELSAFDAWALECIRSGDVTADTQPGVAARLAWLACAKSKSATIESLRAQLATSHALGFKAGIEAGAEAAASWRNPAAIKLAAGEMTAQELRTAQAVAGGIEMAITSLPTPPSILPEILEAMREAETVFGLVETPAFHDPDFHREIDAMGRRIGFGALMSGAEAAWRDANAERGTPAGSEFVAGPCRLMVTAVLVKLRSAITKLGGKTDEA